jgi:glycosyltransferase involved in cell wall biosynthesis
VPDILVISDDVAGARMAGPGIRAWELARRLAADFRTTLAVPEYSPGTPDGEPGDGAPPFELMRYAVGRPAALRDAARNSRIVLIQGYVLSKFPFLKDIPAFLVCDLSVPFPLENLFVHRRGGMSPRQREAVHLHDLSVFNDQIVHGDHFLCANERQRDLILGALLALDRLDPQAVEDSPALDGLVSVVPFGIEESEAPPQPAEKPALRGVVPGIGRDDVVFLWGGVLCNWFDPLTLIRAVERAAGENPGIKLVFLSTGHPNPLLPAFETASDAVALSDELGLTGRQVFFNRDWVDYARRGAFFRDADIGVSVHNLHIETRFAFRTRILDYLKFDLPILCTEGDSLADLVRERRLGRVVPCGDVGRLAEAMLDLAGGDGGLRREFRENIAGVRPGFTWTKTAAPLVDVCRGVFDGRFVKRSKPTRRTLSAVTAGRNPGAVESAVRGRLWFLAQKLPIGVRAGIRRILRGAGRRS